MFCTLRVPARFDRSGPRMPPLPFDHVAAAAVGALPQKIASPAATSPCAGVSIAVPRSPRMYAVTLPDLIVGELPAERRHLRARDPVLDRVEDFLIRAAQIAAILRGNRRAELAARAVLPVARRARLVVQLLAFGDGLSDCQSPDALRRRRRTAAALGGQR